MVIIIISGCYTPPPASSTAVCSRHQFQFTSEHTMPVSHTHGVCETVFSCASAQQCFTVCVCPPQLFICSMWWCELLPRENPAYLSLCSAVLNQETVLSELLDLNLTKAEEITLTCEGESWFQKPSSSSIQYTQQYTLQREVKCITKPKSYISSRLSVHCYYQAFQAQHLAPGIWTLCLHCNAPLQSEMKWLVMNFKTENAVYDVLHCKYSLSCTLLVSNGRIPLDVECLNLW